jgi:hypothetical protein
MDSVLGLLGIAGWIIGVIALAAGVTYLVVKLTPSRKPEKEPEAV